MGTLTLADFRDELRFVCGGIQAGSTVWTNARLDRRINASYLWCSMPNHYRHPELENSEDLTLLANTAFYTLTENWYMIYGVEHVESATSDHTTRRTKLDPIDFREQLSLERQPSKPSRYSFWQDRIILDSVPATAYQGQVLRVHGYKQPSTLTTTGSVTLLKPEWDEIILVGAEWRVWVSLNEADRAYEAKENLGVLVNEVANVRKLHAEEWGWQTGSTTYPGYMRTE